MLAIESVLTISRLFTTFFVCSHFCHSSSSSDKVHHSVVGILENCTLNKSCGHLNEYSYFQFESRLNILHGERCRDEDTKGNDNALWKPVPRTNRKECHSVCVCLAARDHEPACLDAGGIWGSLWEWRIIFFRELRPIKPVLSGHSKIDSTKNLKTNDSFGAFCNTFDLH